MIRSLGILFPTKSADFINTQNSKLAIAGEKLSSGQWSLTTTTCSSVTGHGMFEQSRTGKAEGGAGKRGRGERIREKLWTQSKLLATKSVTCGQWPRRPTQTCGLPTCICTGASLVIHTPLRFRGTLCQSCDRVSGTIFLATKDASTPGKPAPSDADSGFLNVGTTGILGRIIFFCCMGAAVCVVGPLAPSLGSTH